MSEPELLQLLDIDGNLLDEDSPKIADHQHLRLLEAMLTVRLLDARMLRFQRQGRISFYGEATGQEAAVIGSGAALGDRDWVFPALRESGVALLRGYPIRRYADQVLGNSDDLLKGRQMPCHYGDRSRNYVPMSSCIATQLPHAVGAARAARMRGDDVVVIGYMGDGATSESDFHVAMNFAGVWKPPVILFCQNNQWAISTGNRQQTVSRTIAEKAVAYGIPHVRVDGNDILAVYKVTREAADRARRGDGPTFIEALTYRVGAHSSSDDPSRYRDESTTEEWKAKDPIDRYQKFLIKQGIISEDGIEEIRDRLSEEIKVETHKALETGAPEPETMFDDVYFQRSQQLNQQESEMLSFQLRE